MDLTNLPALWAEAWPVIAAVTAGASALDAILPQPAPGSHWLIARKVLSFVAINVGHASNGAQPSFLTWIARVAGPVLAAQAAAQAAAVPAPAPTPANPPSA